MEVQNLNGRFKVIPSAGDCMGKGALKLHRTLQGMPAETGLEEIDHLHSASKAGRTENSEK